MASGSSRRTRGQDRRASGSRCSLAGQHVLLPRLPASHRPEDWSWRRPKRRLGGCQARRHQSHERDRRLHRIRDGSIEVALCHAQHAAKSARRARPCGDADRQRSLQCGEIAVTEVCVDQPLGRLSDPIQRVDAYMICLLLRDLPNNSYWEDGRQVSTFSLQAGEATIHDLRREPLALMDKPIHSLLFYLPCAALSALADQANVPRIRELHYKPGVGVFDETLKHIRLSLLPALRTPDRVTRLFTDHVT